MNNNTLVAEEDREIIDNIIVSNNDIKSTLSQAEDITNKMNIGDPKYKNGW